MDRALADLARADADLARVRDLVGPLPDRSREAGFASLLKLIVEQQVSLASANAIWNRLCDRFTPVTPDRIADCGDEELRSVGLSRPKIAYCRHLAEAVRNGAVDFARIDRVDDATAMAELQAVRGIGRWTAEVYLMSAHGRMDIMPAGDLALQVAAQDIKGLAGRPTARELDKMAEAWRPWRSVAARLLWAYYRHLKADSNWDF